MNFKTTSILFALLLAVGVYIFLTRDTVSTDSTTETKAPTKLLTITASDVETMTITPAGAKPIAFARDGVNWKLTQPITAPAESGVVAALVADIASLQSLGTTDVSDGTGLKTPRFTVDLAAKDGKTTTLTIGEKSAVGERLYVQVKGNSKADTVAAGVEEQLDKPLDDFRQKKLITLGSPEIKYIAIDRPAGKLELVKDGTTWKITAPEAMAADQSAVSDLVFSLVGLQAAEYVDGNPESPVYGLGSTAKTITIGTVAPATQPSTQPTSQPAGQTGTIKIVVGRTDTVMEKNLYVRVAGSSIVAVPKDSLKFVDKTALDLRDKTVTTIDPKTVNSLAVNIDRPATTQPTTKPAEKQTFGVSRRPPASQPTTQASTQPSTAPTLSSWIAQGPTPGEPAAANDSAIEAILSTFHPLKATKYVESAPTSGITVNVTLLSGGNGVWAIGKTDLQIIDPGDAKSPVATYNGLHFEIERALLDKLEADFTKPGKPEAPRLEPPADMGPQMMP